MGDKSYKNRCGFYKTLAEEGFVGIKGFTDDVLPLDIKECSGICRTSERDISGRVVSPELGEEVYIPLHCQSPENILCLAEEEGTFLDGWSEEPDDYDDSDEIKGGAKADDRDEHCELHRYWYLIHPAIDDERPLREPIVPRRYALKVFGDFGGTARVHDAPRYHNISRMRSSGRPSRKPRYKKPWRSGHHDHRIRANNYEWRE